MAYAIDNSDRRRRRAIRALTPLAALLVAALLVWQGSNAAFSATTNNTADAWTTGTLALTNNGGTATFSPTTGALFTETNLKPADTGVKCITVHSSGSIAGQLRLYRGAVTGSGGNLAASLDMKVDAVTVSSSTNVQANCTGYTGGTSGALYNGTLEAMPATYAAASASGVNVAGGALRVVYRIGWTVNSGASNSLQGSSAQADLNWEIN